MAFARILALALTAFLVTHCAESEPDVPPVKTGREIVEEAVAANGLARLDSAAYSFAFRDKNYRFQRENGRYAYERWWKNDADELVHDVLTNEGLTRYTDGEVTEVHDTMARRYANSVNSVVYFAFMPFALLDPAARLDYRGVDTIKGEALDAVYVDFVEENGGDDSGDQFMYWFTTDEARRLKYLAYVEPGNKAPRFREAYNERSEAGITVRDYRNYTTTDKRAIALDSLAPLYASDRLKLLSIIDTENVMEETIRPPEAAIAVPEYTVSSQTQ